MGTSSRFRRMALMVSSGTCVSIRTHTHVHTHIYASRYKNTSASVVHLLASNCTAKCVGGNDMDIAARTSKTCLIQVSTTYLTQNIQNDPSLKCHSVVLFPHWCDEIALPSRSFVILVRFPFAPVACSRCATWDRSHQFAPRHKNSPSKLPSSTTTFSITTCCWHLRRKPTAPDGFKDCKPSPQFARFCLFLRIVLNSEQ